MSTSIHGKCFLFMENSPFYFFFKDTELNQIVRHQKNDKMGTVFFAAAAATPAALQMGHPNTSTAISSQAPPFPTREDVTMATIYYAAAHERVFSDYKHGKRKTATSYLHSCSI